MVNNIINVFKFNQQKQHNSSSTNDNDYAMTQQRITNNEGLCNAHACNNAHACGMSPQHFEWLKNSQGMSPLQLNDKAF